MAQAIGDPLTKVKEAIFLLLKLKKKYMKQKKSILKLKKHLKKKLI